MRPNTNRFLLKKRKDDGDQSLIKFRTKKESKQATLSSPTPKKKKSLMQALHEPFRKKALLLWERTDPCVYHPKDLPMGQKVEEEDSNIDGTKPMHSNLPTV